VRSRAAILTRLERLERRNTARPFPRLIFALDERQGAGEVTGYQVGNLTVLRVRGETAKQCAARAFALQPAATSAAALYGAQGAQECGQHNSWPWPALRSHDALSGPEIGSSAPINHREDKDHDEH